MSAGYDMCNGAAESSLCPQNAFASNVQANEKEEWDLEINNISQHEKCTFRSSINIIRYFLLCVRRTGRNQYVCIQ